MKSGISNPAFPYLIKENLFIFVLIWKITKFQMSLYSDIHKKIPAVRKSIYDEKIIQKYEQEIY